jgi:hypothetical protein
VLEHGPVALDGLLQVLGAVRRSDPGSGDQVGADGDAASRVPIELQCGHPSTVAG